MKKPTKIVGILFIYMTGMTIWGYCKGTATGLDAFLFFLGMCVLLTVLWFLYYKKEKYRKEREK